MQAMTGRGTDSPESPYLVLLPISARTPADEKASDDDRRRVEADAVAAEVASLLKRPRPTRASDVAILLRRLSNVHLFEQALESHGVPYRTVARRRVLHKAGGSGSHQPPGVAGRAGRLHSLGRGPAVTAVHDR